MDYRIISRRIGVVGAKYEPTDGTNLDALVAGGFIEPISPTGRLKSARKEPINEAPDAHHNTQE